MFLKSLHISNDAGLVRAIDFHAGLNLIVDETPIGTSPETGNNVGKTTVLRLIDFCLGADPKGIYTDPENPKVEYAQVKKYLIETQVLITLTLGSSIDGASEDDLVIERNFMPRKQLIRRINAVQRTEQGFEEFLTNHLFPGHYGKKPTFPQIISHNIRYKELSVTNTLRTLSAFTRDDEYETLHLFLLGCDFGQGDARQYLLGQLRTETAFKSRLESKQTRSAYEASLALLLSDIAELDEVRSSFKENTTLEADISELGDTKYKISVVSAELARGKLRHDLVSEAVRDIQTKRADIDIAQLRALYKDVSSRLNGLSKSFDELVGFHNNMIEEKARYISKELPGLEVFIAQKKSELRPLVERAAALTERISESWEIEDLESIILALNERHRLRGEYETIIGQLSNVDSTIDDLKRQLAEIDGALFSESFSATIQVQLNKFNRYFAAISQELYGEQYALKFDRVKTKTGQQVYKFSSFNTNFSSGKKQGEITCFDIAYTLFADDDGIPCYHFLLNDKKELMHDNQLERIGRLVERKSGHVQFVASILRDKLPAELNKEKFIALKLSQRDKLFRIEGGDDV